MAAGQPTPLQRKVAAALVELRDEMHPAPTQAVLAKKLKVDQTTVSNWLRGAGLGMEQLFALEKAHGQEPGYALRRAGIIKTPPHTKAAIAGDIQLTARWRESTLAHYRMAVAASRAERASSRA